MAKEPRMSCKMQDMIKEYQKGRKIDGVLIDGGGTTDYTWHLFARFSPWYLPKVPIF